MPSSAFQGKLSSQLSRKTSEKYCICVENVLQRPPKQIGSFFNILLRDVWDSKCLVSKSLRLTFLCEGDFVAKVSEMCAHCQHKCSFWCCAGSRAESCMTVSEQSCAKAN